jgi:hypothetical protein
MPRTPRTTRKPWREVVSTHLDVASGRYQQAEVAADLWQVYIEEYGKPLRRLYQGCHLVRGNRDLITIVCRLGNDRTGLSLLRLHGHTRSRRELQHGCLLAFI